MMRINNSFSAQYQPIRTQFQNKNQKPQVSLLKNPDADTVSFSGIFSSLKGKKAAAVAEEIIKDGKKFTPLKDKRKKEMEECIINLTKEYIDNPKKNDAVKATVRAKIEAYQQVIDDGGYWD